MALAYTQSLGPLYGPPKMAPKCPCVGKRPGKKARLELDREGPNRRSVECGGSHVYLGIVTGEQISPEMSIREKIGKCGQELR